ncbi:MAG: SCO family protein [Verrucomicrobiales bacterium]
MPPTILMRSLNRIRSFLVDGGLAAFSICLLLGFDLLLITLLLLPAGEGGVASLADELRVWCFGYDPATGSMEWGYVFSMLFPPLMISGFFLLFWRESLRRIFSRPFTFALYFLPAMLLVGGAGFSFAYLADPADPAAHGDLPFPAEALRTHLPTPEFSLVNQAGEAVNLASMRGKVVVLTGVYTCCALTCPQIIAQAKEAIGNLAPEISQDLRFVAITLDPARDTPEVLANFARAHELTLPRFHFASGEVSKVEAALDAIGIARERVGDTAIIDHASQFVLVDRRGKVAYRLGLGERQTRWLESAMNVLLREEMEDE